MKKFKVIIKFKLCLGYVLEAPYQKAYIDSLINDKKIEHFEEDLASQEAYLIAYAKTIDILKTLIDEAPLSKFWNYEIEEIAIDNQLVLK